MVGDRAVRPRVAGGAQILRGKLIRILSVGRKQISRRRIGGWVLRGIPAEAPRLPILLEGARCPEFHTVGGDTKRRDPRAPKRERPDEVPLSVGGVPRPTTSREYSSELQKVEFCKAPQEDSSTGHLLLNAPEFPGVIFKIKERNNGAQVVQIGVAGWAPRQSPRPTGMLSAWVSPWPREL